MICYRDRTYCKEVTCNKYATCPRALTEQVKADAARWWGKADAPIAVFVGAPACYVGDKYGKDKA